MLLGSSAAALIFGYAHFAFPDEASAVTGEVTGELVGRPSAGRFGQLWVGSAGLDRRLDDPSPAPRLRFSPIISVIPTLLRGALIGATPRREPRCSTRLHIAGERATLLRDRSRSLARAARSHVFIGDSLRPASLARLGVERETDGETLIHGLVTAYRVFVSGLPSV